MADKRAVGVFDSGLGGLTVVKELRRVLPNEDIVYFGDTGRVPYGTRSSDTIRKYAIEDENFLLKQNVKLIIAACGTVSSVAGDTAKDLPVPFFEVVSHSAKAAVKVTKNKKIGVIGTAATIKSGKHKEEILKLMPQISVKSQSCSLFVPLVEEGWFDADDIVVLETVKRYLQPIIDFGADTIILGCTHYPVLSDAIKKAVGKDVTLINAGNDTALAVAEHLQKTGLVNDDSHIGKQTFFVSDKADSFRNLASILLGQEIDDDYVKQVELGSL